ncbi:MAG: DNA polymerase III subunit epsilon [Colwellia sp.]|jgi:DNA polymerase-3 subunit epsilon|uniref:DNA polymerase III subunit epsilon n=1 Tax=Colwellia sp. Bg11-12 TaxID=2759817 RepID=UPI0015F770A5|nr:DNA polymerase III subunit epsilon [Colwellia sp. Bg11-12]MBA6265707.1 DNA polymerase III subunit epsilon [Colwellia sp. Bg11-12]
MSIEQDVQPDERLIILDTETTGINPREGHRIVEVGCVEMINRQLTGRSFHVYINPLFEMEQEVINIHGLTNDFLRDKPLFTQVADEFIEFIKGARLVIHNAKFDIGFMDNEFALLKRNIPNTRDMCTVIDTLHVSKDEFGSPKTLDYLARFYRVDKLVDRTYHGALVDAQLLAFVYIEMTRKQSVLNLSAGSESGEDSNAIRRLSSQRTKLKVIQASADELIKHDERLAVVANKGSEPIWPK